MVYFIIAFVIAFLGYFTHTLAHWFEYRGMKTRAKSLDLIFHIAIFASYIGWGFMIFLDPKEIKISNALALFWGLSIGIIGLMIFILSLLAKKGFREENQLITSGIYAKIRHPMYFGAILIHIGFPLAFKSYWTLLSAILWIIMILIWKYWEEQFLVKKFGQKYKEYQKRTLF